MEQYVLYLVLKELISNLGYDYKISFNDYDINGSEIIGIIFKGGNTPKYRDLNTGRYYGYSNRVEIVVQSGYSEDSLFTTLNLINKITSILTQDIANTKRHVRQVTYKDEMIQKRQDNDTSGEDVYLGITKTHLIGSADFKGKSSQTRSMYSINLMVDYYITIGG